MRITLQLLLGSAFPRRSTWGYFPIAYLLTDDEDEGGKERKEASFESFSVPLHSTPLAGLIEFPLGSLLRPKCNFRMNSHSRLHLVSSPFE